MSAVPLSIVVAVAENGVIGRGNQLPWRLKSDLRRFRDLTWGKPMIMGRRTFESIGRALPGRESVVLTRNPDFRPAGAHVAAEWRRAVSLAAMLAKRMGADAAAVIGGAELFRLALPAAAHLHLTLVHARPDGDVAFPAFETRDFREVARVAHPSGPDDEHPFTFVDLIRR